MLCCLITCVIVKWCPHVLGLAFQFLLPVFFCSFPSHVLFPPHSNCTSPTSLLCVCVCVCVCARIMPPSVSAFGMFLISVPQVFIDFIPCLGWGYGHKTEVVKFSFFLKGKYNEACALYVKHYSNYVQILLTIVKPFFPSVV